MKVGAGIHTMTSAEYHADPTDGPSLSASIASILCNQSPAHAWAAHPKLNPDYEPEERGHYDIGTAAHQLLLEGEGSHVVIIDAENWRTKAAQEARDQAYLERKIPLLTGAWDKTQQMVKAALVQLDAHHARPRLFQDGLPEQTLVWQDRGVTCRARCDWLRDDHATIDDLKTTSRSANPEAYSRALFGVGGDVQAAFYLRGLKALTGVEAEWRWVIVETDAPYALSVVSPAPSVLSIGRKKVEWAIDRWRECLAADVWPAYPTEVCYAEMPAYEESRWLERELREVAA